MERRMRITWTGRRYGHGVPPVVIGAGLGGRVRWDVWADLLQDMVHGGGCGVGGGLGVVGREDIEVRQYSSMA
jgi:hypothetical protein